MRIFHCDRCGEVVAFSAQSCRACGAAIGYVSDAGDLRVLLPTADPRVFGFDRGESLDGPNVRRCHDRVWGCNWVVPADSAETWCRSCRLTRGRPDVGRPDAIEAWAQAEAAKRRLVHQLDELALPIETMSDSMPDGLVFDLVELPGEGGITGQLDGVVTLDFAETDELHRGHLRRRPGEPFRTVIGHLRHEIGHVFWDRLVGQSDDLRHFRRVFGDERDDYAEAVGRYDSHAGGAWDRTRFVTAEASAHPLEDWAETFARYLHVLDAVDTARDRAPAEGRAGVLVTDAVGSLELVEILAALGSVDSAVNAAAETFGTPAAHPFDPADAVVDKLAFVHGQIAAHTARDRFYANH